MKLDYNLKKGLIQRVSLFEKILNDLYGAKKIIKNELLPKSILFANPLYFQTLKKIKKSKKFIYVYTPTLSTNECNIFFVLNDNLNNPNFTFFKEISPRNRNKFFKNFTKKKKIHSAFFDGSECFYYMNEENLLSKTDEFYVENENFIVKNEDKKISIDLIFRTLPDELCDSLEFNSCQGIPYLFQLIRLNKIDVVNAIGTQLLETPFFQKQLNNLCQFFLKENLILPTIPLYWGKLEQDYKYISDNFDNLFLTHVYTNKKTSISFNEFKVNPELYIAQMKEPPISTDVLQYNILLCNDKYFVFNK